MESMWDKIHIDSKDIEKVMQMLQKCLLPAFPSEL